MDEKEKKVVDLMKTANAELITKVDELTDKVEKLEALPAKNTDELKGSGIEVGRPGLYKGFNFKKQATDAPELFPESQKEKDAIIKEVIDVFAPYSKNAEIRKAAMQEGAAGEGLEYVPELWFNTVIEKARLTSVALAEARRLPMAGNILHIPKQGTSVSVTYAAEESASSESEPGSAETQLTAGRFGLWGKISQELLDDAMIDIVSYVTRDCVEAVGQTIDDEVFNGTSAPFTALLGAGSTDVTFGAAGTGTSIADMVSQNFFSAIYSLPSVRAAGAKFYLHRNLMPYIMNLKWGASDFPLMTLNPSAIAGYPFSLVEAISGTDSTATDFVAFGNLQNYALGIRSLSQAIEVNPYGATEFKQYQVLFRFYIRAAGAPLFSDVFVNMKTA